MISSVVIQTVVAVCGRWHRMCYDRASFLPIVRPYAGNRPLSEYGASAWSTPFGSSCAHVSSAYSWSCWPKRTVVHCLYIHRSHWQLPIGSKRRSFGQRLGGYCMQPLRTRRRRSVCLVVWYVGLRGMTTLHTPQQPGVRTPCLDAHGTW